MSGARGARSLHFWEKTFINTKYFLFQILREQLIHKALLVK